MLALGTGHWALGTGHWAPGTGHRAPGCRIDADDRSAFPPFATN